MIPTGYGPVLFESVSYFFSLAIILVPLFVAASFIVGLIQEYLPPDRIEGALSRFDGGFGNVAAASVGGITPFCSCSTVPILAGLLGAGAPLGIAFSFLLASPIVNWIAVFLLVGLFTVEVAALFVFSTIVLATIAGIIIGRFELDHLLKANLLTGTRCSPATDGGASCGCDTVAGPQSHKARLRTAAHGSIGFLRETIGYLVIGMALAALIHGVVPESIFTSTLGSTNPLIVLIAAVAGAPIYISMSGMLPIAYALVEAGMPIGTVLAFVIGSAGVSLPNLVLLNALFTRRLLVVYAGLVVTVGVSIGWLFNLIFVVL